MAQRIWLSSLVGFSVLVDYLTRTRTQSKGILQVVESKSEDTRRTGYGIVVEFRSVLCLVSSRLVCRDLRDGEVGPNSKFYKGRPCFVSHSRLTASVSIDEFVVEENVIRVAQIVGCRRRQDASGSQEGQRDRGWRGAAVDVRRGLA